MTKEKQAAIKLESTDRYLLTVLAKDETALPQLEEKIKSLDLKLEKTENLGRRILAYPIKKLSELTMLSFFFKGSSELTKELDKGLRHDESVYRYLLTNWNAEIPIPREDRRGKRYV